MDMNHKLLTIISVPNKSITSLVAVCILTTFETAAGWSIVLGQLKFMLMLITYQD